MQLLKSMAPMHHARELKEVYNEELHKEDITAAAYPNRNFATVWGCLGRQLPPGASKGASCTSAAGVYLSVSRPGQKCRVKSASGKETADLHRSLRHGAGDGASEQAGLDDHKT